MDSGKGFADKGFASIADMGLRVWDADGRFGMGICGQCGLGDRGIADDYGCVNRLPLCGFG